jgi:hypothetical protein
VHPDQPDLREQDLISAEPSSAQNGGSAGQNDETPIGIDVTTSAKFA